MPTTTDNLLNLSYREVTTVRDGAKTITTHPISITITPTRTPTSTITITTTTNRHPAPAQGEATQTLKAAATDFIG